MIIHLDLTEFVNGLSTSKYYKDECVVNYHQNNQQQILGCMDELKEGRTRTD